ncbi:MAG TPA: hypothetical protein VNS46_21655 [Nocardioides sp.]|nr:hypothetical protein [Nocardioides sp.]
MHHLFRAEHLSRMGHLSRPDEAGAALGRPAVLNRISAIEDGAGLFVRGFVLAGQRGDDLLELLHAGLKV